MKTYLLQSAFRINIYCCDIDSPANVRQTKLHFYNNERITLEKRGRRRRRARAMN